MAEIAYCCDHLDVAGFTVADEHRGDLPGRSAFATGLRRARPARRPPVHPPDVAGLLGADVVRPSPADARVLLRHHPGRRRPGAQRHRRPAPRDRVPHPARRRDAADGRRPGQRLLPAARRRSRRWTCFAIWAGSTSTSPASRSRVSSTRCSRSPRSSTFTTGATTPSPRSSPWPWPVNDWPRWATPRARSRTRSAPTPNGSFPPSAPTAH